MSCCGSCGGQNTDKTEEQDKGSEIDQESTQAPEKEEK
jgi:hypothetical protein